MAAALAACLSGAGGASAAIINAAEPFIGVTHFQVLERLDESTAGSFSLPRPLVIDILRIDPTAPGVQFLLQPGNGPEPGEVRRSTTRGFVDSVGAQIGINGDFFGFSEPNTDVVHTAVSDGEGYSPHRFAGQSIFNVGADNVASVLTAGGQSYNTAEGVPLYNAIGGNQRLVTDGVNTTPGGSYTTALNPHSALGVTHDGQVLFMTVDGRQGFYSGGMRTDEMADLLIEHFNAKDVINVDGGGSTTLVMDDTNDGLQNARVVNSPSDNATPQLHGNERLNGNNFAVFAPSNPDYMPLGTPERPLPIDGERPFVALTVLDDFESGLGHFDSAPAASGSSRNVASSSTATLDSSTAASGTTSLRLDLDNTGQSPERMQLRFLSGGGSPIVNLARGRYNAMGDTGSVGFALKLDPGNAPLYAGVLIDDGDLSFNGLERSDLQPVIADGQWHVYQWSLEDAAAWNNYANGNGQIDGPNAYIDSIFLSSSAGTSGGGNWQGTVWIDYVAHDPNGPLVIPEPAGGALLAAGAALCIARRRRRRG